MNIISLLVAASATIAYSFLIIQALRKNQKPEERLSFSSFFLWSIIDGIMWVNTAIAKNDQTLICTYTVLTVFLTSILLIRKQYGWNNTDTKIAWLAFSCLVISIISFFTKKPIIGVTCGALSISIAGIPHLIKLANSKPTTQSYLVILFFLTGPCISIINLYMKSGEIKEYIYPGIAITYWFIAFLLTRRAENQ